MKDNVCKRQKRAKKNHYNIQSLRNKVQLETALADSYIKVLCLNIGYLKKKLPLCSLIGLLRVPSHSKLSLGMVDQQLL